MNISTINLKLLPNIEKLKRISQSIAMLDAIISQEWEYRYYSFNSIWSDKEMMASMANGQGKHYFIQFLKEGAAIKGYDKDAPIIDVTDKEFWNHKRKQLPNQFEQFLNEPAFDMEKATFLIWRLNNDYQWKSFDLGDEINAQMKKNDNFDGSQKLITILRGFPKTYKKWADTYYEGNFSLDIIEKIYRHESLTKGMVETLNPSIDYNVLMEDIEEIGYPWALKI